MRIQNIISNTKNGGESSRNLYELVGGFKHVLFSIIYIYGLSSFPLTNSIIFQDGRLKPPTSEPWGFGSGGYPSLNAQFPWKCLQKTMERSTMFNG